MPRTSPKRSSISRKPSISATPVRDRPRPRVLDRRCTSLELSAPVESNDPPSTAASVLGDFGVRDRRLGSYVCQSRTRAQYWLSTSKNPNHALLRHPDLADIACHLAPGRH